jgi:glutathione S-transferase
MVQASGSTERKRMDYVSVAEARKLPGLRLALSAGTPGPWGEAAKALFKLRNVPFVPVRQHIMEANEELVAWTGHRNAPVAIWEDEPGVAGWIEILMLAERLGSGPSLLPADELERISVLGISAEICSPGGFGWERRLTLLGAGQRPQTGGPDFMSRAYGVRDGVVEPATERVIAILGGLSRLLERQRAAGSDYLVGHQLTAADVYWACFSQLIGPMPPRQCPMGDDMRAIYSHITPEIEAAVDPALLAHRDMVWQRHIGLPMEF